MARLNKYRSHSGLWENLNKFAILFSRNTSQDIQHAVDDILKLGKMNPRAKYLGLPPLVKLQIKHNKKETFEDVKNKILNRVSGWK